MAVLFQNNKKLAVPDWSDLHPDLLEQVAIKLIEIEDFTASGGVCSSWRDAVAEIKDKFVSKVPQLMFQDEEGGGFYSWRKRKVFSRIAVPEFKGKRCIGVGFGWILTEEEISGELSLVNPRSCAKIQLPKMISTIVIRKAVVSANPFENPDFMVIVDKVDILGIWKNGDTKWSMLEATDGQVIQNICYYKHKLYAVDFLGELWMWDPYNPNQPAECIIMEFDFNPADTMFEYLVESSKGELLLIHWNGDDSKVSPCCCYFRTFRIDIEKRECTAIQTLDGDAIFVDVHSAVSVAAADFPGIVKPNCIYFPDHVDDDYEPRMRIHNVDQLKTSLDYDQMDVPYSKQALQWLL